MKKIIGYMVFTVCLVCISSFANNASGQEKESIVVGKVIEISPNENIIQVKERSYFVTAVYKDDGTVTEPGPGYFGDLKVGSIVELHVQGKYKDFLQAKKVIIFTGNKEKKILQEIEPK